MLKLLGSVDRKSLTLILWEVRMFHRLRVILVGALILLVALSVMKVDTKVENLRSQMKATNWQLMMAKARLDIVDWEVNKQLIQNIEVLQRPVVFIEMGTSYGSGSGSGVIIGPNTILTAKHVVDDADYIVITGFDGNDIPVLNIEVDPNDDVAVITVDANLSNFVSPADNITLGERVIVIGAPFGKEFYNTVTVGIVSGLNRNIPHFGVCPIITVDAAVNPGNSGGPVFNINGELIGIVVGLRHGANGFSIIASIDTVKEFLLGRERKTL